MSDPRCRDSAIDRKRGESLRTVPQGEFRIELGFAHNRTQSLFCSETPSFKFGGGPVRPKS